MKRSLPAFVSIGVLFGLFADRAGAAAGRPNFLVILADDLGWGDLACHGQPKQ